MRRLRVESELKRELESFASYHFYTNEFSKIHSEQLAEKVVAFCKDDRDLSQDDRALYVIDGLLQIIHGKVLKTTDSSGSPTICNQTQYKL